MVLSAVVTRPETLEHIGTIVPWTLILAPDIAVYPVGQAMKSIGGPYEIDGWGPVKLIWGAMKLMGGGL